MASPKKSSPGAPEPAPSNDAGQRADGFGGFGRELLLKGRDPGAISPWKDMGQATKRGEISMETRDTDGKLWNKLGKKEDEVNRLETLVLWYYS